MKSIILTGGGTAGHCMPNLALVPELKERFDKIYYIGSHSGIEKQIVTKAGIEYFSIDTAKLNRSFTLKNLTTPFKVLSGINQAKKIGVDLSNDEVTKIEHGVGNFKVVTSKKEYLSKIVIIATGNKKNSPKIKGIQEFEGRGVSYCAICDGFFYKNKDVAVLGNGNYAISEVNDLINICYI